MTKKMKIKRGDTVQVITGPRDDKGKRGEVIRQRSQMWGITDAAGESFFFFGDARGFVPGNYEIRLTIGPDERAVSSARFTVVPQ